MIVGQQRFCGYTKQKHSIVEQILRMFKKSKHRILSAPRNGRETICHTGTGVSFLELVVFIQTKNHSGSTPSFIFSWTPRCLQTRVTSYSPGDPPPGCASPPAALDVLRESQASGERNRAALGRWGASMDPRPLGWGPWWTSVGDLLWMVAKSSSHHPETLE